MRNALFGTIATVVPVLAATNPAAAEWPERPLTLVVPFKAGGITDLLARRLQPGLEKALGQKVIVINVGGHSSVGTRRVIDAESDGSQFLIHENGIITAEASGVQKFGYRDLVGVAGATNICLVAMMRADKGWKTVGDMVAAAKSSPKPLIAGVTIGGLSHMAGLAIARGAGINIRFVQIGGSAAAYSGLVGKQIDMGFFAPGGAMKYTRNKDGKVMADARVVAAAYSGLKRFSGLPEVPTYRELGYKVSICVPHVIYAPKETPQAIVDKMAKAVKTAYNKKLQALISRIGGTYFFKTGSDLRTYLDDQWQVLSPLAKLAGGK